MHKFRRLLTPLLRNRWLFRLIGVGILVVILLRIDLGQAWRILTTADARFLLLSLILQAIGFVVATYRWQLIMHNLDMRPPFSRSLVLQLIGTGAGLVTPGQFGEFIKVLYHRRDGYPVPESSFSVFLDRLFDLALLIVFSGIGIAILFGVSPVAASGAVAVVGLAAIILFVVARHRLEYMPWIGDVLIRVTPADHRETVRASVDRLVTHIRNFGLRFLLVCSVLTVFNYIFLLLRIYALVLALHLIMPFWYFALVVPLLRIVGLIPISIAGLGTRDVTTIYLFGQVGIPGEASLVVSMLSLLAVQLQALLGLFAWWRYPLQFEHDSGVLQQDGDVVSPEPGVTV